MPHPNASLAYNVGAEFSNPLLERRDAEPGQSVSLHRFPPVLPITA